MVDFLIDNHLYRVQNCNANHLQDEHIILATVSQQYLQIYVIEVICSNICIYSYKAESVSVCYSAFHVKNSGGTEKFYFKHPLLNSSWSVVGILNLNSEVIRGHFLISSHRTKPNSGVCNKTETLHYITMMKIWFTHFDLWGHLRPLEATTYITIERAPIVVFTWPIFT